jgi:hypothetical protein
MSRFIVARPGEKRVREHLGRIVRGTVEETLNAEADRLCTGIARQTI